MQSALAALFKFIPFSAPPALSPTTENAKIINFPLPCSKDISVSAHENLEKTAAEAAENDSILPAVELEKDIQDKLVNSEPGPESETLKLQRCQEQKLKQQQEAINSLALALENVELNDCLRTYNLNKSEHFSGHGIALHAEDDLNVSEPCHELVYPRIEIENKSPDFTH